MSDEASLGLYEMLVGLNVIDDQIYQQYREAMSPILKTFGGAFGYDFKVAEVLKPAGDVINRVFTINFPDSDSMEQFFTDPDYLAVKEQYFSASVASTTIISSYKTTPGKIL